jgi:hypothetical protein
LECAGTVSFDRLRLVAACGSAPPIFLRRSNNGKLETRKSKLYRAELCLFTFVLIMMLAFIPTVRDKSGEDESISDSH